MKSLFTVADIIMTDNLRSTHRVDGWRPNDRHCTPAWMKEFILSGRSHTTVSRKFSGGLACLRRSGYAQAGIQRFVKLLGNLTVSFKSRNLTSRLQSINCNSGTKNRALGNCPASHSRPAPWAACKPEKTSSMKINAVKLFALFFI